MDLKRRRIDRASESDIRCLFRCSHKSGLQNTNTTIDDLSNDQLVEIFVRLPTKLAHQCMSVCKGWFNLISDPGFVRNFIRRQFSSSYPSHLPFTFIYELEFLNDYEILYRGTSVTSFSTMSGGSRGFSLDFLPAHSIVHSIVDVKGSSGDLLLCSNGFFPHYLYYVCNPFTKQWVELPPTPNENNNHEYVIGFVCDSKSDVINVPYRYRVVGLYLQPESDWYSFHMDIYCSETGKWSELDVRIPSRTSSSNLNWHPGTFRNSGFVSNGGILHWIIETQCIMAYDPFKPNNDECRLIDMPSELKTAVNLRLGVCRDRLRLLHLIDYAQEGEIYNQENVHALRFRVWELQEYDEGKWCLVHDFPMELEDNSYPNSLLPELKYLIMSMAFHPYDGDVVYLWFPKTFISCNLQQQKLQVVRDHPIYVPPCSVFPLVQHPWCPTTPQ